MQQLYDQNGHRKYLTPSEREAFLKAADAASREVRTFCALLTYTGCTISEALALTADRVDLQAGAIVFETLKKRKRGIYRPVP
jgi:integrase